MSAFIPAIAGYTYLMIDGSRWRVLAAWRGVVTYVDAGDPSGLYWHTSQSDFEQAIESVLS